MRTVRDVILEVDGDGNVVDDFRLFEILDPYRDNVIKTLDQGAVCLNIDAPRPVRPSAPLNSPKWTKATTLVTL